VTPPRAPGSPVLEDRAFLVLLVAVSLAFAWTLWPFSGSILWGVILAIVFIPLYRHMLRLLRQRPSPAALATLATIVVSVILPVTLVAALLVQEGTVLYDRIQSGEIDVGRYFQQGIHALPAWVIGLLDRLGLTNLDVVEEKISTALRTSVQFLAGQALNFGQNTLAFVLSLAVMLYLLFFLLRDGDELVGSLKSAIPLRPEQMRTLADGFAGVIRATVKGSVVVALVQGALGGLIFWLLGIHAPVLWAALMAILSLLPAVGTGMVWLPVAIYFLATGATWQGILLIAYGALIMGNVDNVLRPVLVGKETKMPDYLVLLSTLGGIVVFGVNGTVIGPLIAAMFIAAWGLFSASRTAA
jgi:predicted PurR-regulated permease PerM